MESKWTSVEELFSKNVQYKIPLFQRHYVWDNKVWRVLWNDITEKVVSNQGLSSQARKRHFTGAIVTQLLDTIEGEVPKYEVIDGQQRLTTFQIILCAIRDICQKNQYSNIEAGARNHILNRDFQLTTYTEERYKLIREESRADESDFLLLVDGQIQLCKNGNILSAYRFFAKQIEDEGYSRDRDKITSLYNSISADFGVVQIEIDSQDDESEKIFASLNTTGKLLREFDHLRNNLFLRARTSEEDEDSESLRKDLYRNYWSDFEEQDYWRSNANNFLITFLKTKLGLKKFDSLLKSGSSLFDIYQRDYRKDFLRDVCGFTEDNSQLVLHEFGELKRSAEVYREEIDNENLEIGHPMEFYKKFRINSLHPFLLFIINESKLSDIQIDDVFKILESYILRRFLCCKDKNGHGYPRIDSFFNETFQKYRGISKDSAFRVIKFVKFLSQSMYDHWPSDCEVKTALGKVGLNQKVARYILYRIERWKRGNDPLAENTALLDDDFTLEHIMPQGWKESWPLPVKNGKPQFFADLYTQAYKNDNQDTWYNQPEVKGLVDKESHKSAHDLAECRKDTVQNLGNLTIVSKKLNNGALRDKPFNAKKELLFEHSDLRLNKSISQYTVWDADQIYERGTKLFEDFCQIWPSADSFEEKITGRAPDPKPAPAWISMFESGSYQFLTLSSGPVNLAGVKVTSGYDVEGDGEDGQKVLLDWQDVVFVYKTAEANDVNAYITSLDKQEPSRDVDERHQLRIWDSLLLSSQENEVDVTLKTRTMHELLGTIVKFDDDVISMKISGYDVMVFRHSLFEFATDELYDGEVARWGPRSACIKCSTNPREEWQNIYVHSNVLGECETPLIAGQKVKFNVKIVLKNWRPRLEVHNVVLRETETHEGTVTWVNPKGYGRIRPSTSLVSDHRDGIFVHVSQFPNTDIKALQEGQKVKFNVAETVKDSEKRLQAYNVVPIKMTFQGEVSEYSENRGFGFIQSDEIEGDIFVHASNIPEIKNKGIQLLKGQKVEFDTRFNKSKSRVEAYDVTLVGKAPLYQGTITELPKRNKALIKCDTHEKDIVVRAKDVEGNTIQVGWKVEFNILASIDSGYPLRLVARNVVITEKPVEKENLHCGN